MFTRPISIIFSISVAALAGSQAMATNSNSFLAPLTDVDLIDHGTMVVTAETEGHGGDRTETFEVLQRQDGGRTIVSITTPADGSYRVQGRWDYDAENRPLSAHGQGIHGDEVVTIDIIAAPPAASMRIERPSGEVQTFHAPCKPRCLVDMTPSALPMFTMTRHYDRDTGGVQRFPWVGYGLTRNTRLTEGSAELELVGDKSVELPSGKDVQLQHFTWTADLVEDVSGRSVELKGNLWVDQANRPIKFTLGPMVSGIRETFEAVDEQLVAQ